MGIQGSHLDRVAVWDEMNGTCPLTYFDIKDAVRYGLWDNKVPLTPVIEDALITFITTKLKTKSPDFLGKNFTLVAIADVPVTRVNRDCWSLKNGKVIEDPVKLAAKQSKVAKKQSALNKLKALAGLDDEDLDLIGIRK